MNIKTPSLKIGHEWKNITCMEAYQEKLSTKKSGPSVQHNVPNFVFSILITSRETIQVPRDHVSWSKNELPRLNSLSK